ncbi:MAG: hypothetical protein FJW88_02095 [Actinobacteria bacterium]|nr:hypothetical protein [Actinomycetota bacterium]
MRDHASKLIGKVRDVAPEGTFAVGAGLAVAAATAYVFVIVALNSLGEGGETAFGLFWSFIFVAGPGLFLPLEQEVGRALAHRRAQGLGGKPLVVRAARLGGILTAALVVIVIATSPLYIERFDDDWLLVASLAVGLVGFYCMHTVRGTLSGNARFRPYGEMLATEGAVRLGAAIVLTSLGANTAGAYGMCIALAPFAAVLFALRKQHGLLTPGPPAPYSELSNALGWLLAGSVLMQLLAYSSLLGINFLESSTGKAAAAAFTSAFFVARIPVLLFQAVQGTLLPKLANLAGAGRHDDFRTGFKQLLLVVVGIAGIGTLAAFAIGPAAGKILFEDFTIDNLDLGLLALGSGIFIVALTIAQALIALHGHRTVTFAWGVGVLGFLIGTAAIDRLPLRVEVGFVVGSTLATAVMAAALIGRMRKGVSESIDSLITAIGHEPLEL